MDDIDKEMEQKTPLELPTTTDDHIHDGISRRKNKAADLESMPMAALTAKNSAVLSTGGAAVLSASDQGVIDNLRTRLNDLESRLQTFGLLK